MLAEANVRHIEADIVALNANNPLLDKALRVIFPPIIPTQLVGRMILCIRSFDKSETFMP